MNESLMKFMEMLSQDAKLQGKADELIANNDAAGIVALAASLGIELAEDELLLQAAPQMEELSDDELDAVAGGWKKCTCVLGGGGKADADGLACACVAGGIGVGRKDKEVTRCACVVSGFGGSPQCMLMGC